MKFAIRYSVADIVGTDHYAFIEADSLEQAQDIAYQEAVDLAESWGYEDEEFAPEYDYSVVEVGEDNIADCPSIYFKY